MKLSLGIVGLPNVGKSTLFNALTKQNVLAANYPFATIDPNHGIVPVRDERLSQIAKVQNSEKIINAAVEFVDIAGLVKGASKGEGLGNQFLANIRETSAIVQVVRAFEDGNITHVEDTVNPLRDIELIQTELLVKDIDSIESRIKGLEGKAKSDAKQKPVLEYVKNLLDHLGNGNLANSFERSSNELCEQARKELFLLTDKPIIYLVNVNDEEKANAEKLVKGFVGENHSVLAMDIKVEAELIQLDDEDRAEFMKELGIEKSGLDTLTMEAYSLLSLQSFFTAGPMEARAWTIKKGDTAPQAAAAIHNDFEKNFIAADVVTWKDFVDFGGWNGAKDNGKQRLEGRDYIVNDGDVMLIKHNAR